MFGHAYQEAIITFQEKCLICARIQGGNCDLCIHPCVNSITPFESCSSSAFMAWTNNFFVVYSAYEFN
jgi:hypothetical protein